MRIKETMSEGQTFLYISADRAKQIKTKATINEDPTEKLIRDLQEENEKLKAILANGGQMTLDNLKIKKDDDDDDDDDDDTSNMTDEGYFIQPCCQKPVKS